MGGRAFISAFALLSISVMVLMIIPPGNDGASPLPQIIEFEDEMVFISVGPDDERTITINATVRSLNNRNTVYMIESVIENGNFWTADHQDEIYLEPFEEWVFEILVTAPVGEPVDKEVELTIKATSDTEIAYGSDSVKIRVLPYLSSSIDTGTEYLLDMPLAGDLPVELVNTGNSRSVMGIRVEDSEMGIQYLEQRMIEPGASSRFMIYYSMPGSSNDIVIDLQPFSGDVMGDGSEVRFIRDGDILHILFGRGPFLILLPGPLDVGSVKVMSLGGEISDIWVEPMDIGDDTKITSEGTAPVPSLERRDISIFGEGFTGSKTLILQAHGYHAGYRISSNPLLVIVEGKEEKDGGIPKVTLMYAGGGASALMATFVGTFAYLYSASEVFKYKWLLIAFIPMYSTIHREKVLDHFFRGRLFEYIKENPGVTFTGIKEHFEVNNGTLTYHLHKLEKEELIAHRNIGKYKLFYADGVRVKGVEAVISSIDREIISMISHNPGVTSKQLALLVSNGRSERTFSRHIKQLERKGFIVTERKDGKRILFLTGDLERVLIPKKGVVEVSEMTQLDL